MTTIFDRYKLLIESEATDLKWLEDLTAIKTKRWQNIKYGQAKLGAEEIEALGSVYKEYAYWLTTGEELPEAGQISPMTKKAQRQLKKTP